MAHRLLCRAYLPFRALIAGPIGSMVGPTRVGRRDEVTRYFKHAGDKDTRKDGWQRDYFLGRRPDGSAPDAQHVNKLRLAAPVDMRKKR
jgi:hypothetical protein